MRVKERWRIDAFMRSVKAVHGSSPTIICSLPVAGADRQRYPGADRRVLAAVYCLDGKAIVRPSTLRCGILVVEWSAFMRYLRRHRSTC